LLVSKYTMEAQAGEWKITVHEVMSKKGAGTFILSTFSIRVAPTATVEQFLQLLRDEPTNPAGQKTPKSPHSYRPFSEAIIGQQPLNGPFIPMNPDAVPNCKWPEEPPPDLQSSIGDVGLCAGAALCYRSKRSCD